MNNVNPCFLLTLSTIQGTLPKSRHFLFVDDAIEAFLLLLEKGIVGEIYNVGSSCEIPIMHLGREMVKMVSYKKVTAGGLRENMHQWQECSCVCVQVKNVPDSHVNDWLEFVPDRWEERIQIYEYLRGVGGITLTFGLCRPRVELRYPITCEKLQQLGWRARTTWSEGIRHTGTETHTHIHTYRQNQLFPLCNVFVWSYSEVVSGQPRLLGRDQRGSSTNRRRASNIKDSSWLKGLNQRSRQRWFMFGLSQVISGRSFLHTQCYMNKR